MKIYKCDLCNRHFKKKSHLVNHHNRKFRCVNPEITYYTINDILPTDPILVSDPEIDTLLVSDPELDTLLGNNPELDTLLGNNPENDTISEPLLGPITEPLSSTELSTISEPLSSTELSTISEPLSSTELSTISEPEPISEPESEPIPEPESKGSLRQKEQIILKNTFDNTKWRETLMKEWNEAKAEFNMEIKNELKILEEKNKPYLPLAKGDLRLAKGDLQLEEITDLPKENYNHEPYIFNEYEKAKMYLNSLNKNKRQKTERKINIKHYSKEDKANMMENVRNKIKKINFTPIPIKRNLRKSKKNIE